MKGFMLVSRHTEFISVSSQKGFTLIELLVVVLIIGILAAVAVPQYQTAVDKSRFMNYLQAAHSIRRAEEVFYMSNGYYSPDLGALDIDHRTGCKVVNPVQNEWQCPDGFLIDLVSGYGQSYGFMNVALCPDYNTGSGACYKHTEAVVTLSFDYPSREDFVTGCKGGTARGRRICKALGDDVTH